MTDVDCASVMLGIYFGVVTRVMQKYPQMFSWYCLNNTLELSAECILILFKAFRHLWLSVWSRHCLLKENWFLQIKNVNKLYSLCRQRPKYCHALEEACRNIGMEFPKIRWDFSICEVCKYIEDLVRGTPPSFQQLVVVY